MQKATALSCAILMAVCVTMPSASGKGVDKPLIFPHSLKNAEDASWANEAWTGSDAPFTAIRQEIDGQMKKGDPATIVHHYRSLLAKDMSNAHAAYAFAYSVVAADRRDALASGDRLRLLGEASLALGEPASPHSQAYDRLRFLLCAGTQQDYRLVALGKRLLKTDPNNLSIKRRIIVCMSDPSTSITPRRTKADVKSSLEEARRLAEQDVKEHPKDAYAYSILATVCYVIWRGNYLANINNRAIVDEYLDAERTYARLDGSPEAKQHAKTFINLVQSEQALLEAGKNPDYNYGKH